MGLFNFFMCACLVLSASPRPSGKAMTYSRHLYTSDLITFVRRVSDRFNAFRQRSPRKLPGGTAVSWRGNPTRRKKSDLKSERQGVCRIMLRARSHLFVPTIRGLVPSRGKSFVGKGLAKSRVEESSAELLSGAMGGSRGPSPSRPRYSGLRFLGV